MISSRCTDVGLISGLDCRTKSAKLVANEKPVILEIGEIGPTRIVEERSAQSDDRRTGMSDRHAKAS
jgi:hypothetical protein